MDQLNGTVYRDSKGPFRFSAQHFALGMCYGKQDTHAATNHYITDPLIFAFILACVFTRIDSYIRYVNVCVCIYFGICQVQGIRTYPRNLSYIIVSASLIQYQSFLHLCLSMRSLI